MSNIKLTSIKSDTRYTTTQQIVKLNGSYEIQKVSIKVSDIKRTKMVSCALGLLDLFNGYFIFIYLCDNLRRNHANYYRHTDCSHEQTW